MSDFLSVPSKTFRDIKECLKNSQKIKAVKLLRAAYRPQGENGKPGVSLRDAKLACDRLEHEIKGIAGNVVGAKRIIANSFIQSITLQMDGGELTVDLDQMEMRALMGLESMGIEEVARVLDLVKVLKAFSAGADINMNYLNNVDTLEADQDL